MTIKDSNINQRKDNPFIKIIYSDGVKVVNQNAIFNRHMIRGYELIHLKKGDGPILRVIFTYKRDIKLSLYGCSEAEIKNAMNVFHNEAAFNIIYDDEVRFYGTLECPPNTTIQLNKQNLDLDDFKVLNIRDVYFIYPEFSELLNYYSLIFYIKNGVEVKWWLADKNTFDEMIKELHPLINVVTTPNIWDKVNRAKQKNKKK